MIVSDFWSQVSSLCQFYMEFIISFNLVQQKTNKLQQQSLQRKFFRNKKLHSQFYLENEDASCTIRVLEFVVFWKKKKSGILFVLQRLHNNFTRMARSLRQDIQPGCTTRIVRYLRQNTRGYISIYSSYNHHSFNESFMPGQKFFTLRNIF